MRFSLVDIDTSFPIRFLLCTETEIMLTQKKENMKKVQVNNNIFYYQLSGKPNVEIMGITLSMCK